MTADDGPQVAYNAAASALAARGIDGLPTDVLLTFAYLDSDGAPKLALYYTEIVHGPLGLAQWAKAEFEALLVNKDHIL